LQFCGANGRDPVIVDVSISVTTVQITMTAADPGDPIKGRSLPRDALTAAMASAAARPSVNAKRGPRLVSNT
jgi:hypothetical protein